MKKQALFVALLPLLTAACGGVEDTQSSPQTQSAAALSASDPLIGNWCLADSGWGCMSFTSSGSAYISSGGDNCWFPWDQPYSGSGSVVSTGTDMNGDPTYAGTRQFGGSSTRCYDAALYSATLVIKTNPTKNRVELIETIQRQGTDVVITWVQQ